MTRLRDEDTTYRVLVKATHVQRFLEFQIDTQCSVAFLKRQVKQRLATVWQIAKG